MEEFALDGCCEEVVSGCDPVLALLALDGHAGEGREGQAGDDELGVRLEGVAAVGGHVCAGNSSCVGLSTFKYTGVNAKKRL